MSIESIVGTAAIQVRKRNGDIVAFDSGRVENAIARCLVLDLKYEETEANSIAASIGTQVFNLASLAGAAGPVGVEEIQNQVETQLMANGLYAAAKQYILFRETKRQERETAPIPEEVVTAFAQNDKFFAHDIQKFQALDKFARFDAEKNRRETWPETVVRVMTFFKQHCDGQGHAISEGHWEQLQNSLLNLEASPSMRCVQMAGPSLERCHVGVYNCLGAETAFVTDKGVRTFVDFSDGDRVRVLGHSGQWRDAVVRRYGRQVLNTYTFARGRTALKVRATANHRWLLDSPMHETWRSRANKAEAAVSSERSLLIAPAQSQHGHWETTDLQIGDRLVKTAMPFESWEYSDADPLERLYWAYGYVYGDGTRVKAKDGTHKYSMVRLCGAESKYQDRFEELGFTSSSPLSCGGDYMAYTGRYLKTLPDITRDGVAMVRAFVRGYLDADGAKSRQNSTRNLFPTIQATGEEAIAFIREVFPAVGVYILREEDLTDKTTNFGERTARTIRFSLLAAVGDGSNGYYSCDEIVAGDVEEDVWCLEVETDESFTLANGLVTGNCSFQFLQNTTDMAEELYVLMQGTGVGFSVEAEFAVEKFPRVKRQKSGAEIATHVIEDTTEGWCDAYKLGLNTWWAGEDVKFDYSMIRPEGTPLKTKGGKASGPGPLKDLLEFARTRILARQGRFLTSLDLHDINCFAHRIVKMGGVRRASGISLSDLHDREMRDCKQGEFWNNNGQRNQANNSAVYNEKPDAVTWMEEWLSLAKSGSGERGIFNRGALKKQFPKRRKTAGFLFGTNPCVTGDTWVPTDEGPRQVTQLLDAPFTTFVDGVARQATNFFQTGVKPVFQVTLANGMRLRLTGDHQVLAVTHQSRKVQRTAWKPLSELSVGDRVIVHNHRELATWTGRGTRDEGWLLGNLLGDGCFGGKDQAILDYWGEDQHDLVPQALELVHATVGARSDCQGSAQIATVGKTRIQSSKLGELARNYGVDRTKQVGPKLEQTSACFHAGFLSGWFDADGSVQGDQAKGVSVRLSSSQLANLEAAQRMLHRLGINSTIYAERRSAGYRELPDGQGGVKSYWCEAQHELVVANDNLTTFRRRVGFRNGAKAAQLDVAMANYSRKLNRDRFAEAITSIEAAGVEAVYDCQVPGPHAFDANGLYVHNCGEIILRHKQFCNLSIAVILPNDSLDEIRRKVVLATIWGTIQSTMTKFNYIGEEWTKNSEEERLLGVDLLGFLDHPLFQDNAQAGVVLDELRQLVIATNAEWAQGLGINASTATTCIKPSGDSSVFFGTAAGFKGHHGVHYVRRTRSNATNPVALMLKDEGVPCHTDYDGSGLVLEWPMKAPEGGVLLETQTALSQLEKWKTFKIHWTEHNPSVTIYVRPEEWIEVGKWVYDNWDIVGGLSFLPYDGGVYHLAPYEAISQEDYDKRVATFPAINWAKLVRYEKTDMTDLHHQFACHGDKCAI